MRRLHVYAPPASKLHLAHRCAFPWSSGIRAPRAEDSPEAIYGRTVSVASEFLVNEAHHRGAVIWKDKEALARLTLWLGAPLEEHHQKALPWDVEAIAEQLLEDFSNNIDTEQIRAEVGYAYDLTTGAVRLVPQGERKRPGEVRGWADLVITHGARVRAATVRDWKSGRGPLEPPEHSDQLRFLGLCVALVHGLDRIRVEFGRLNAGELRIESAELDCWKLGDVQGELEQLARKLAEPPEPTPGPWCRSGFGCHIVAQCPSTEGLANAAIMEARPWLQGVGLTPRTAEEAAAAYGAAARMRAAADRIEDNLRLLLPTLSPPPQIAPGVELVLSERAGAERVVGTEAANRIVEEEIRAEAAGDTARADQAVVSAFSRSTSKSAIDDGLRHIHKPGMRGRPAKVEALYARLRKRGALDRDNPSVRIEERRVRET